MINNQINKIENFFKKNETKELILNTTGDDVIEFYIAVFLNYTSKFNKRLIKVSKDSITQKDNDLFIQDEPIEMYSISNKKKFEEILSLENKKIIITDYKLFKFYKNKIQSINTYLFEKDIKYFIRNELNIKNEDLINFCINNPFFVFSETSKYLINQNISLDKGLVDSSNHILEIRKSIYNLKNNKLDLKTFYSKIKDESLYKKFNFLIY